jgi:hypothetical protein
MAIQQNFPSTRPSLNLNFARSKTLDPRITFTRTSSATYVDENGLVKIAPANSPRFDHDPVTGESLGLLIEEQRANLVTYSEDFRDLNTSDTWEIFGVDVVQNSTISPDGTLNATKLINTSGTASRRVSSPVLTVVSGTTYTHSVWLKAGEYTTATVFCNTTAITSNFNNLDARINLLTGQISGTVNTPITVTPYPNGWWRVSSTFTTDENTTITGLLSIVPNTDAGGVNSVVGDGVSGIYVWGAQLETGSFQTSYIPTTDSTATRTPDNARILGSNFSSWYNPNEGSLFCSGKSNSTNDITINIRAAIATLFETSQTGFSLGIRKDTSTIESSARVSGFSATGLDLPFVLGNSFKSLLSYSRSNLDVALNGLSNIGNPLLSNLQSNPTRLILGNQVLSGNSTFNTYLNGTISQLTYYPSRLSNSQLQTLTK